MSEAAVPLPLPESGAEPVAATPATTPRWRADAALCIAAFFFGTTFLVVQDAVERTDPLPFLAVRFLIGGTVLAAVGRKRPATRREIRHGVVAGIALLAGYVLQTVGLQYTTPSTSAFITYMLVVLVPLLGFVALGRRPPPLTLAGVALAVVGMVLLTGGAGTGFGRGEVLTLGCAIAFATHILILGETATRHDPVRLAAVQILTVGIACLLPSMVAGPLTMPRSALAAAAFTGVFATAVAFLAMVWAQRIVSPTRAALILLLEPVFAALLGWAGGDPLSGVGVLGGALILVAVVVAEVGPGFLTRRSSVSHALD